MTSQYRVTLCLTTALSSMPSGRVFIYKESDCLNKMETTHRESSTIVRTTRKTLQIMRASITNIAETSTRFKWKSNYAKAVINFGYFNQTTVNPSRGLPKLPVLSSLDSIMGPPIRRKMFTYYTPSREKGDVGGYSVTVEQHLVYKFPQDLSTTEMDRSPEPGLVTPTCHPTGLEELPGEQESKLESFPELNMRIPTTASSYLEKVADEEIYNDIEQDARLSEIESKLETYTSLPKQHSPCLEVVGYKAVEQKNEDQESTVESFQEASKPVPSDDTSSYEGMASVGRPVDSLQDPGSLYQCISLDLDELVGGGESTNIQREITNLSEKISVSTHDEEIGSARISAPKRRSRPRRSVLNTDRKMFMTSKSSGQHEQPESDTSSYEPRSEPTEQLPNELITEAFGYDVAKYPFWMVDTKFPLPVDLTEVELPFINRKLINFQKNEEEEFCIFAAGTSNIYHALKDGTNVLVKDFTNSPKASGQILDECRIMSLLAGTSITPHLHGVVEQGFRDDYFMVMDRCEGFISLTQLLASGLYVPESSWIQICVSLASHLKILHEHKILHNNIHTDNILVNTDTLEVKLVGFGSASYNTGVKLPPAVLEGCDVSPEVKLGCFSSTESDIYALGSVLEKVMRESRAMDLHQVVEKTHQDLPRDRPRAEQLHSLVLDIYHNIVRAFG